MKQVALTGERRAELIEVPEPQPLDDWVVVKVTVAPMCTEYKGWLGGWQTQNLGHEAVGEVAAVARPGRHKVGDRVVVMPQYPCGRCALCVAGDYIHCEHCVDVAAYTGSPWGTATYAQYVIKPDWICVPIPDDLSDEQAGLALCALGPSMGAFDGTGASAGCGVGAFDTVLVTGLGPVGLGGVVNAVYRGARVIAVESNPYRANLARELGAETVLDPRDEDLPGQVRALTAGRGADVGLDCSGSPQAHRLLIDAARRRGTVVFVGESGGDTVLHVSPDLIRKGLSVKGSWHYNLNLYPKIVEVVRHSPVAGKLITHTFGMSAITEAFETLAGQQTGKVLLKPWE
jgi:L-iditol 2-dehydrogenase